MAMWPGGATRFPPTATTSSASSAGPRRAGPAAPADEPAMTTKTTTTTRTQPMTTTADPTTTALLIMDYQPATLGFLADSDAFVATAQSAADALRAAGGTVVFVRVAFTDADYAQFPSRSVMGQRVTGNRPGLDADSPTSALHRGLAVADGDLVVRKTRVGSFSTTKLNAALTDSGIDTLLLAGVHTSGAVLTTVREAHDLDYDVTG